MIRIITMLSFLSVVFCQYPRQRAPSLPQGPPPPQGPPRQGPPPQPIYEDDDYRPQSRNKVVYRPASVHYVNIGAELAGDYKFGYDTGKANDGQSFREETRLPDGSVQGAYGYVDETGKQRIVKYTAGKEGFKVVSDDGSNSAARSAAPRPAPEPRQPVPQRTYTTSDDHQQAYRSPHQQAYDPPQPASQSNEYAPPSQPAYRPSPPQPSYRASPPQPSYRAPPAPPRSYAPEPQAYAPEPQNYAPRPRSRSNTPRPRYVPEPAQRSRDSEPDYDYPENDITERRLAPIDTSLLNYNIGTSNNNHK